MLAARLYQKSWSIVGRCLCVEVFTKSTQGGFSKSFSFFIAAASAVLYFPGSIERISLSMI